MRKHLSVLALWVRSSLPGALGILAAMAAAEIIVVRSAIPGVAGIGGTFGTLAGEVWFDKIFAAALVLLWIWLSLCCTGGRYTLGRLEISPRAAAIWQGVNALGWLLALRAVQTGVVLLACRWYAEAAGPEVSSGQSLYLACHSDEFLRFILPLEDVWGEIGGFVWMPALALSVAGDQYTLRRGGRFPLGIVLLAQVAAAGSETGLTVAVSAVMAAVQVLRLRTEPWEVGT